MSTKFIAVLALAVAVSALPVVPVAKIAYPETPAQYDFQYSVHDGQSGDVKQQQEARTGDTVHGSYSLVQPDGVHRIVEYTADKENGFNAIVSYDGHPIEAPAFAKIAYAAPAKVAYSVPNAYTAPVAKVAYAAPVSKAYSAPLAHVSYSSPIISYQH